jgi:hypothetical protein
VSNVNSSPSTRLVRGRSAWLSLLSLASAMCSGAPMNAESAVATSLARTEPIPWSTFVSHSYSDSPRRRSWMMWRASIAGGCVRAVERQRTCAVRAGRRPHGRVPIHSRRRQRVSTELGACLRELGRSLDGVESLRESVEEPIGVRPCRLSIGAEGVGHSATPRHDREECGARDPDHTPHGGSVREGPCASATPGPDSGRRVRQHAMGPMVRGLMG